METVFSLVSLTVTKVLQFSGLVDNRNVLKSKKMEEKALEVYGEWTGLTLTCNCGVTLMLAKSGECTGLLQEFNHGFSEK